MTIHWCGTGLSSVPGLRRLLAGEAPVVVWNRTVAKAQAEVGDLTTDIRAYDLAALTAALQPGDIAVSMLPADNHVAIAQACLSRGAHFVSSSYIAPEMRALDEAFRDAGLVSLNEIGLDPGIDHLMAHDLVARVLAVAGPGVEVAFTSYCGGVPKEPNAFRYKFSWSPLGVLKALRSPSRSIRDGAEVRADRPWHAISAYAAPLPVPETFEVYPNRDSLPFVQDYGFDPGWTLREFVRGTIRLEGWAQAWAPVFAEIETLDGPAGEVRLAEMAAGFWRDNAYGPGEPDRVVLIVALKAVEGGRVVFHQTWALDAWGDARGSAMGRLVSTPVALGVEAVLAGRMQPGMQAATRDPALLAEWMAEVGRLSQHLTRIDHLA